MTIPGPEGGGEGQGHGGAVVSVVIPTRNRSQLIGEAVRNALDQRGVEVEVVVVDDASTDDTPAVLAGLGDPRLRVVRREEQGRLAAARNSGIDAAAGEWVAFLDDDDIWSPDKLRLQLEAARKAGAGFAYGGAITVSEHLEPRHLWRLPQPDDLLRELLALNVMPAGASNVVGRLDLVRRLGGFDPTLSHTTDWDMWIRMAEAAPGSCVPDVLCAYRLHPHGQESDRGEEMLEELDVIDSKHRELREQLGVDLDRAAFEDYVAKRRRPAGGPSTGLFARGRASAGVARSAAGRLLRRGSGRRSRGPATPVSSPDWLRSAGSPDVNGS